jgi:hypothetical protein
MEGLQSPGFLQSRSAAQPGAHSGGVFSVDERLGIQLRSNSYGLPDLFSVCPKTHNKLITSEKGLKILLEPETNLYLAKAMVIDNQMFMALSYPHFGQD